MRAAGFFFVLATAALLTAGCGGEDDSVVAAEIVRSDAPRATGDIVAAREAAAMLRAFASDLYLLRARDGDNFVVSPYSIAVALAMARAGAAGETALQMDAVLHASLSQNIDQAFNSLEQALAERPGEYEQGEETVEIELGTANQLWGQRGFAFDSAYLERLASDYGAGMMLVDFIEANEQARATINEWVAEQTRDRIPELIPEGVLNQLTRLVLTNAIYLKAPWMHPFDKDATVLAPFQRLDGSEVQTEMMLVEARLRYADGAGYQAVELPYAGGMLSMLVVLPNEGDFAAFEGGLSGDRLRELTRNLRDAQVMLRLPSFEFRSQALLKPALSEMGMPIAFTEDADFSGMSPQGEDMFIQDVVHEAFISVDEAGTEAAAATAVVIGIVSAPDLSIELTVDRPFFFLIRDAETEAILFMGRVLDPRS